MKFGKRVVSVLLAGCLLLSLIPSMALAADTGHPFKDVASDAWCNEAVEFVYERGLMAGTSGTTFAPDATTTRGQIVTILWRQDGSPDVPNEAAYTDVSDTAYYAEAVQWAHSTGVAGGYGNGQFSPNAPITRQQLAAMLYRYADSPEIDNEETWAEFSDADQVSTYAADAMAWAVDEGLIAGTSDGRLNPQGSATRAHVATILMRFITSLEEAEEEQHPSRPSGSHSSGGSSSSGGGSSGGNTDPEPPIEETSGEYAITGFTMDGTTAKVVVSTVEACKLRVQFVDEATSTVIATKELAVEANLLSETKEISLDVQTAPDNCLVQCDLLDGDEAKLCNTYTSLRYTDRYEAFDAKTPDDFTNDGNIVISNESDKKDDSFAVLVDGAQEIHVPDADNTLTIEGNTYTLDGGNPEQFQDVQPGDVLYLPDAPVEQSVLKVESIQTADDGRVVIQAQEDCTLSDFYQYLNIDTMVPVGEPVEEEDSQMRAARVQYAPADSNEDDSEADIDKDRDIELKFEPFKKDPLSISGKGTASFHIRLVYDIVNLGENYFEYENTVTTKLETTVELTAGYSDKELAEALKVDDFAIELFDGEVQTWIPGLSVGAEVKLPVRFDLEAGLKCSATLESTTGFLYTKTGGYQSIRTRSNTVELDTEGSGDISFSARGAVDVNFLNDILKAEAGSEIGVKVNVEVEHGSTITSGAESYHACETCLDAAASVFLNADLGLSYKVTDRLKGTIAKVTLPALNYHLQDYYWSLENEPESIFQGKPSKGEGECPNCKYLVTFETQGNNGETVTGAEVSVIRAGSSVYEMGVSPCSDYFYPGNYTATAKVNGNTAEKEFTVDKAAMAVVLKGQNGTLEGTITDGKTGKPVSGAAIEVLNGEEVIGTYSSNAKGEYIASIPAGSYTLRVSASGYETATTAFAIDRRQTVNVTLQPEQEDAGTLYGIVTDAETSEPVSGVTVKTSLDGKAVEAATSADGSYTMALPAGTYTVTFQKEGYASQQITVTIKEAEVTEQNVALQPVFGSLKVTVTDGETAGPMAGAAVEMEQKNGQNTFSGTTGSDGVYTFASLPAGDYELRVTAEDYAPHIEDISVAGSSELERAVTLQKGGTCGPTLYWRLEEGTLTIYGEGTMYDYNTMGTSEPWYSDRKDIVRIVVEPGATSIGNGAFKFTNVVTASLPNTIETIGGSAFYDCRDLTAISIPGSVKSIGIQAFMDCQGLETLTLSDGLVSIERSAFNSCSKLTGVNIPGSVQTIGENAFFKCYDLEFATLHDGLISIGESAFENCYALTAIHIPNSVTSVGQLAFKSCNNLAAVTLSNQLTTIPYSMFHNDGELKSITLPEGITEIEGRAFSSAGLTSIDIPDGVTRIGEEAFYNCDLTSVHIPTKLEEIGSEAFYNCNLLTGGIVLPASVHTIGKLAFSKTSLSEVTMQGAVESIGYQAFSPDTLTDIHYQGTVAEFNKAMKRFEETDEYLGLIGKTIYCTDDTFKILSAE